MLWDLKNKTHKQISQSGNIYSAYFIKNSHNFMWQDLKNIFHIQNIDGKEIKSFKTDFPSYGEVMTEDLKYYIASNKDWGIHYINLQTNENRVLYTSQGGIGAGKLVNLTIHPTIKHF